MNMRKEDEGKEAVRGREGKAGRVVLREQRRKKGRRQKEEETQRWWRVRRNL